MFTRAFLLHLTQMVASAARCVGILRDVAHDDAVKHHMKMGEECLQEGLLHLRIAYKEWRIDRADKTKV